MSGRIYLASSWRNARYLEVLGALRGAGHDVYDFRAPRPGDRGFHWTDVWKDIKDAGEGDWRTARGVQLIEMLEHPIAKAGFQSDMDALRAADITVLVLPCGRSAHLELGYAVGAGKPTAVLLDDTSEPELMYRMVTALVPTINDLLSWLWLAER